MTKQTAKELLEIAANDIQEIDLSNYLAMYRINDIANQLIKASALLGEELFAPKCEDCAAAVTITLEPYGSSSMATIECPNCGVSYDTNLDPIESENM